ncbi:MAG: hypothetical protein ABL857_00465 [Rickettsiales bacterium]|jgi:hypothetical protein
MPIIVNDIEITDEEVFSEMQYHSASSAEEAQYKAALALTIRELLLQEAARLDISAPDNSSTQEIEEDYKISRLLEQEVITPEADEISCQRYYDQNQKTFRDKEGNPVAFEHVQPTIAAYLKEVSWQTATKQYLKIITGKSNISGIHLESTDSPLVQ